MPMTYAEHERKKKSPAVCELFFPAGSPKARTSWSHQRRLRAGYELRGILGYSRRTATAIRPRRCWRRSFEVCLMSVCASSSATRSRNAWRPFRLLRQRTARQSAGGDGARCAPAADVAREGASRLLLREPVAGLLRLGPAHFMPSSITRPNRIASWAVSR